MNAADIAVLVWLCFMVVASCIACSTIYQYISNKPPIDQTIIDLIYQDCFASIPLFTLSLSVILMTCLNSQDQALSFPLGLVFANVIYFFVGFISVLMAISSFLRFLSFLYVSEEAGLQLLGPDDNAILLIRCSSIIITLFTMMFGQAVLNTYPPVLAQLLGLPNTSFSKLIQSDPGFFTYFVLPIVAIVLNCSVTIVSKGHFNWYGSFFKIIYC